MKVYSSQVLCNRSKQIYQIPHLLNKFIILPPFIKKTSKNLIFPVKPLAVHQREMAMKVVSFAKNNEFFVLVCTCTVRSSRSCRPAATRGQSRGPGRTAVRRSLATVPPLGARPGGARHGTKVPDLERRRTCPEPGTEETPGLHLHSITLGRSSELTSHLGVSGRSCIWLRATEFRFCSHVSDVLHKREWRQGVHFEEGDTNGSAYAVGPSSTIFT